MINLDGGWKFPKVAQAQRTLVEEQLAVSVENVAPFAAFLRAMQHVPSDAETILDLGCGAGHYGVLCARNFPNLRYTGMDSSEAMIEQAKQLYPLGEFIIEDFVRAPFWNYGIILVAQVIEYQLDPWAALVGLVSRQPRGTLILHRLRLTREGEPSHAIQEATYVGHRGRNYLWEAGELLDTIRKCGGEIVNQDVWGDNVTLVVKERR